MRTNPKPLAHYLPWLGFLLLCAVFFLTCHDLTRVQVDGYNQAQDDIVSAVETGSPLRQVAWISLGVWAAWSLLFYKRNRALRFEGVLGPVLAAFVLWAFLSFTWADDVTQTGKRLVSLGLLCLVAAAVVRRFSMRQIVLGTMLCTLEYLLFAIAAELVNGTFHPLSGGWRFGGLQHPNSEGIELAPLVLSALAAVRLYPEQRKLLYGILATGVVFLLLTGSRTSLLGTIVAALVYAVAAMPPRRRATLVPPAAALLFSVTLLLCSGALPVVEHALLLGRDDVISQDLTSFTGRTMIWEDVSSYISERPLLGHGYNGFWTPEHISDISKEEKWGVPNSHSTYVDYVLALGVVGAALYAFAMGAGLWRAVRMCLIQHDASLAYVCGLLVFSIMDGATESGMGEGELATLLSAIALLWLASVPLEQIWQLRIARETRSGECAA